MSRARRWVRVSTIAIPGPRPPVWIIVTQLIDSDGNHWERYGHRRAVNLGKPPRAKKTSTASKRRVM